MGGLPIGVVIIVLLILSVALYVFLNSPSMFEGEWKVIKYDGPLGADYADVLQTVTFSLSEDNSHIILHPTNAQQLVFTIQKMEPSHIIADSGDMKLEFNIEDPNTNEVSLILSASHDSVTQAVLHYGNSAPTGYL